MFDELLAWLQITTTALRYKILVGGFKDEWGNIVVLLEDFGRPQISLHCSVQSADFGSVEMSTTNNILLHDLLE